MRPFLVTELQAGKLPRWALWLLCGLYALPGFIGRDPWRTQDAAGFGVALTMARGGGLDWLVPNVAGAAINEEGPLPFWLAGFAARWLPFPEHLTVRLAAVVGLMVMLIATWYATYLLAKRPGLQPGDPFGASASRIDFGRAVADSSLLVVMAMLGLVARLHETTAEAAQLTAVAMFLFGAARGLDRPLAGGLIAGAAIGASALTRGLVPATGLLITLLALPVISRDYRLVGWRLLAAALPAALAVGASWPLVLAGGPEPAREALAAWLGWNRLAASGPDWVSLGYYLRTMPWFWWPAWPIAGWAIWRWRSRLGEPAIALPLVSMTMLALGASLAARGTESELLLPALPMAMLAAFGLPTLKRSVVSLVDWFAVMTFTLFGIAVWAYWLAYMTGFPPKMAASTARLAPGFKPDWIIFEIVLGGLATIAWLALVRWRISRQPPMIWRAVVLSSGGLVLLWFLLMTLWLPVFNERNTYRDVGQHIGTVLPKTHRCVDSRGVGLAERASIAYFGQPRLLALGAARPAGGCDWLLVQDNGPLARALSPQEPGWRLRWEGGRRGNADERFRLYERAGATR